MTPFDVLVDTLIDTLTLNASFRVKKTWKYRYIRRRRAGSRDANEGPYSEEAWENIRRVQEPTRQRVGHREVSGETPVIGKPGCTSGFEENHR